MSESENERRRLETNNTAAAESAASTKRPVTHSARQTEQLFSGATNKLSSSPLILAATTGTPITSMPANTGEPTPRILSTLPSFPWVVFWNCHNVALDAPALKNTACLLETLEDRLCVLRAARKHRVEEGRCGHGKVNVGPGCSPREKRETVWYLPGVARVGTARVCSLQPTPCRGGERTSIRGGVTLALPWTLKGRLFSCTFFRDFAADTPLSERTISHTHIAKRRNF